MPNLSSRENLKMWSVLSLVFMKIIGILLLSQKPKFRYHGTVFPSSRSRWQKVTSHPANWQLALPLPPDPLVQKRTLRPPALPHDPLKPAWPPDPLAARQ